MYGVPQRSAFPGNIRFGRLTIGSEASNIEFNANGEPIARGDGTFWDDMQGSLSSVKTIGPGVTLNDAEQTIEFSTLANLSDFAWISHQLPHKWRLGSSLNIHIHWEQTSAAKPNWLARYRWQTNGAPKTTIWQDLILDQAVFPYTNGTLKQISHGIPIAPPAGYGMSDILQVSLFRDNANTSTLFAGVDTYAGIASVVSEDVHIEIDTNGSRSEFVK